MLLILLSSVIELLKVSSSIGLTCLAFCGHTTSRQVVLSQPLSRIKQCTLNLQLTLKEWSLSTYASKRK